MRKLTDNPVFVSSASSKKCGSAYKTSGRIFKLKAVTIEDRQRLRISSYQYLLP